MNKFRSIFKKDPEAVALKEVAERETQAKLHIEMYISNAKLEVIAKERELESLEDKFVHGDKTVLGAILTARKEIKFLNAQPVEAQEYCDELLLDKKRS